MTAHQLLARLADHVVVTSEAYAERVTGNRHPPVSIVPWGVDPGRFEPAGPSGYDGSEPLRGLFVGQLRPVQGSRRGDRRSRRPAGSRPHDRRARTRGGVAPSPDSRCGCVNVRMTGFLDEEALIQAYRADDVCVLPSTNRGEAFGIVLLEGMAAGCVPVASDLPGVRDVARPLGALVAPGDAQDIRWALRALAARPAAVRRLQTGAIEVVARHSWDAACSAYARLAERLTRS